MFVQPTNEVDKVFKRTKADFNTASQEAKDTWNKAFHKAETVFDKVSNEAPPATTGTVSSNQKPIDVTQMLENAERETAKMQKEADENSTATLKEWREEPNPPWTEEKRRKIAKAYGKEPGENLERIDEKVRELKDWKPPVVKVEKRPTHPQAAETHIMPPPPAQEQHERQLNQSAPALLFPNKRTAKKEPSVKPLGDEDTAQKLDDPKTPTYKHIVTNITSSTTEPSSVRTNNKRRKLINIALAAAIIAGLAIALGALAFFGKMEALGLIGKPQFEALWITGFAGGLGVACGATALFISMNPDR